MTSKDILLIFAVLLILLTLLGAFGGAIKYTEPFYQEVDQPSSPLFEEHFAASKVFEQAAHKKKKLAEKYTGPMAPHPSTIQHYTEPTPPVVPEMSFKPTSLPPMVPPAPTTLPTPPVTPPKEAFNGFMIEPFEEVTPSSYPADY